jgi:hypothetical protein
MDIRPETANIAAWGDKRTRRTKNIIPYRRLEPTAIIALKLHKKDIPLSTSLCQENESFHRAGILSILSHLNPELHYSHDKYMFLLNSNSTIILFYNAVANSKWSSK